MLNPSRVYSKEPFASGAEGSGGDARGETMTCREVEEANLDELIGSEIRAHIAAFGSCQKFEVEQRL